MVVNTSRIFTMAAKIPKAQVNNPDILRVSPISANELQVSASAPGVTQVNLWDTEGEVHTVHVVVTGDVQELEMALKVAFPQAAIQIRPMNSSVLLVGYVPRADLVDKIIQIAEDYYPKVITNIRVGGVQTVLLHVKVMEVSRGKARALGIDWNHVTSNAFFVQGAGGLIDISTSTAGLAQGSGDTLRYGIVDGSNTFTSLIDFLQSRSAVKILAEPTLVTMSGRPASFQVGGEFPILVPAGLNTVAVEFKEFGTRVDFVPIVLGNGRVRLEVRPTVSEIDESRNVSLGTIAVPGLRTRTVDTGVELNVGQTLALAGLIQERVVSETKGVPWVSDIPYLGACFRRVKESVNEIELLILVTPELAGAMDPHEAPSSGPGMFTTSPSDTELYLRAYPEVPKCCEGGNCAACRDRAPGAPIISPEAIEPMAHTRSDIPEKYVPTGENSSVADDFSERVESSSRPSRVRADSEEANKRTLTNFKNSIPGELVNGKIAVSTIRDSNQTDRVTPKLRASSGPHSVAKKRGVARHIMGRKSLASNPHKPHKAMSSPSSSAKKSAGFVPSLIGPVGYDVHP